MTFFELMLVVYRTFLEYALMKDGDFLFILQEDTDSSCATFQDIMRNHRNSEVMWLGNDWPLNVIKGTENPSDIGQDFLTKPLSAEKFYEIRG